MDIINMQAYFIGRRLSGSARTSEPTANVPDVPVTADYYLYGTVAPPSGMAHYNGYLFPILPNSNPSIILYMDYYGTHLISFTQIKECLISSNNILRISCSFSLYKLNSSGDSWVYDSTSRNVILLYPIQPSIDDVPSVNNGCFLFWSSFDILLEDGPDIAFYGSEPITTQVGNIAIADGEGYVLYNGAVTSDISEFWDKSTYPYALLHHEGTIAHPFLIFCSHPMFYSKGSRWYGLHTEGGALIARYKYEDNSWRFEASSVASGENCVVGTAAEVDKYYFNAFWSNASVPDYDGSVYIAATDHIPLASNEPIRYEGDIPVYEKME